MLPNLVANVLILRIGPPEFVFERIDVLQAKRILLKLTNQAQREQCPPALGGGLFGQRKEALKAGPDFSDGLYDTASYHCNLTVAGNVVETDVAADPSGAPSGWAERRAPVSYTHLKSVTKVANTL